MPTNTHYFKGNLRWAKVFPQNRDKTGPDGVWEKTNGACTVDLVMDAKTYKNFVATGCRLQPKKERDGETPVEENGKGSRTIQFRRPYEDDRNEWNGGAPEVVHADGSKWNLDEDGLIGNDSTGIVAVDIYDTKTGKGHRLKGVQVVNLIPYESDWEPKSLFEPIEVEGEEEDQLEEETEEEEDEIPY